MPSYNRLGFEVVEDRLMLAADAARVNLVTEVHHGMIKGNVTEPFLRDDNGDGLLDIVHNDVSFAGRANGGFSPDGFDNGTNVPPNQLKYDFNQDGLVDQFRQFFDGSTNWLALNLTKEIRGNGVISVLSRTSVAIPTGWRILDVVDMNHDTYLDVLVTGNDFGTWELEIYFSDSAGDLVSQGIKYVAPDEKSFGFHRVVDANQDGFPDLIERISKERGTSANVWINDGGLLDFSYSIPDYRNPLGGEIPDQNGDGISDYMSPGEWLADQFNPSPNLDVLHVVTGTADGNLGQSLYSFETISAATGIGELADVNGDNRLDFVTKSHRRAHGGVVSAELVHLGVNGRFVSNGTIFNRADTRASSVMIDPHGIILSLVPGEMSRYRQFRVLNDPPVFAPTIATLISRETELPSTPPRRFDTLLLDLNEDGHLDAFVAADDTARSYLGDGHGNLVEHETMVLPRTGQVGYVDLVTGADGQRSIRVVSWIATATIALDAHGNMSRPVLTNTKDYNPPVPAPGPLAAASWQANTDGEPVLYQFEISGEGNFGVIRNGAREDFESLYPLQHVLFDDFTGDGIKDVLGVATYRLNKYFVPTFAGNEIGYSVISDDAHVTLWASENGYRVPIQYDLNLASSPGNYQVVAEDVDNDGDLDVVFANHGVRVWKNLTSGPTGDLDGDGSVTGHDVDLLCAAVHGSRNAGQPLFDLMFDLTSDGAVDDADMQYLVEDLLETVNGDLDLNGKVDFDDFLQLSSNFGRSDESTGWQDGNLNCDDRVDFEDFLLLSANFGFDAWL